MSSLDSPDFPQPDPRRINNQFRVVSGGREHPEGKIVPRVEGKHRGNSDNGGKGKYGSSDTFGYDEDKEGILSAQEDYDRNQLPREIEEGTGEYFGDEIAGVSPSAPDRESYKPRVELPIEEVVTKKYSLQEAVDDSHKNYTPRNITKPPSPTPLRGEWRGSYADAESERKMEKLGWGRDSSHCARLLSKGRSPAEYEFGHAYIDYGASKMIYEDSPDLSKEELEARKRVTNGEGIDTMMWWTFAPYLYKALVHPKGKLRRHPSSPEQALKLIVDWAATGDPDSLHNYPNLKGLESLRSEHADEKYYVLGSDPNGASHKYTEQEARRIAETVLRPLNFRRTTQEEPQADDIQDNYDAMPLETRVEDHLPQATVDHLLHLVGEEVEIPESHTTTASNEQLSRQNEESAKVDIEELRNEHKMLESQISMGSFEPGDLSLLDRYLRIGVMLSKPWEQALKAQGKEITPEIVDMYPMLSSQWALDNGFYGRHTFCILKAQQWRNLAEVAKNNAVLAERNMQCSANWIRFGETLWHGPDHPSWNTKVPLNDVDV